MGGRRVMPRPRGIHSSGLSFAVGGKLMKFALSAQARGGGERERERKAVAGKHVLSRVGEPLWSMCRHCTTYVYICMEIIATSAKYIPPNVPSRYSIPGGKRGGHLDLPKHFKSYRSGDRSYNNQPFEDIFMDEYAIWFRRNRFVRCFDGNDNYIIDDLSISFWKMKMK